VDQAHVQIAHLGAVLGLVKQGILAVQNRLLERSLGDIVVPGIRCR